MNKRQIQICRECARDLSPGDGLFCCAKCADDHARAALRARHIACAPITLADYASIPAQSNFYTLQIAYNG